MTIKEGETWRCPDPECGCEILVTKGAKLDDRSLRCCGGDCDCGEKMQKMEE